MPGHNESRQTNSGVSLINRIKARPTEAMFHVEEAVDGR